MEESSIRIRRMTAEDIDSALPVEEASFRHPWTRETFHATLLLPYAMYFVAEVLPGTELPGSEPTDGSGSAASRRESDGARIVGMCGLRNVIGTGEITNVGVLPAFRRRGIARRLLETAIREGEKAGTEEFTLEVRAGNGAAIALYDAFGFAVEGRRRDFYEAPREDALIMWRRRPEG